MRASVVISALMLLSCGAPVPPRSSTDGDLLSTEPPRLANAKQDQYLAVLASVFGDEQGMVGTGCLQALVIPRNGPERIVYIDCLGERDGMPVRVVRLVAKEDVSDALTKVGFGSARKVGVERTEATLDAADSRLLGEIWWAMLEHARPKQGMGQVLPRYYFSSCKPLTGCRGAVGEKSTAGTMTSDLMELAELLGRLTDSDTQAKATLIGSIRQKASALRARLKSSERREPPR